VEKIVNEIYCAATAFALVFPDFWHFSARTA
jgi:hypothetical protein